MGFSWKNHTKSGLLLAVSLLIFGCGGGGGASAPTAPTNTISGKTSLNGAGLAGVTVTIAGPTASAVTTDADGNYVSSAVANGSYTVTPSVPGFSFSPSSQVLTVADGNVTVPQFTATATSTSFTVSGRVTLSGAGLAGVTVTIAGAGNGSATTDAGGNYSFPGVPNGNCTITPALAGHTFSPFTRAITVANGNVTVPDFAASAIATTFTISGRVSLNGTGLAGVLVTISGAGAGSLTTDATGNFSFSGVQNGNYTITPSVTGYTFLPVNRTVTVNGASLTGQEFVGVPTQGSIIIDFG
jgi:hypothetical protein